MEKTLAITGNMPGVVGNNGVGYFLAVGKRIDIDELIRCHKHNLGQPQDNLVLSSIDGISKLLLRVTFVGKDPRLPGPQGEITVSTDRGTYECVRCDPTVSSKFMNFKLTFEKIPLMAYDETDEVTFYVDFNIEFDDEDKVLLITVRDAKVGHHTNTNHEIDLSLIGVLPKLSLKDSDEDPGYHVPWHLRSDIDPDLMVPVPFHCLSRMFNALSYTQIIRPGTCLERDVLQVEQCILDEIKRRKKK